MERSTCRSTTSEAVSITIDLLSASLSIQASDGMSVGKGKSITNDMPRKSKTAVMMYLFTTNSKNSSQAFISSLHDVTTFR